MLSILALAVACTNPVNYGAVPDDGNDDTAPIQKAIDAVPPGGTLCMDYQGSMQVTRQPRAWNRYAALNTHNRGMTVRCSPGSSIDLVGDQGLSATFVWAIDGGAKDITFDGCTLTTSGAWNTDEQTHVWATTGVCSQALGTCTPIERLTIRNSTCIHPRGDTRRGDCIRLLGDTSATRVIGVLIEDNHLTGARACVEFQRGLEDVVFRRNICDGPTADQHADGEASGVIAGLEVKRVKIYENTMICGPLNQGDYDISMTSGDDVEIYGNHLCYRGIKIVKSLNVHIHHQRIWLNARSNEGAIEASNVCDNLWVHDSTIVREGVAGPLVRLVGHGTASCNKITIENVSMVQKTPSFAVYSENASDLVVRDSTMSWTVPAPNATAVYAKGTIKPISGLVVNGNTVVGAIRAVMALDAGLYPIADPIALDNIVGTTPMCTGSGCP